MHQYCTYILLLYTDLYSWVIQTLFGNVVQGNLSFSCVQCKECTCTLYSIYCMTYVSTVCTSHSSHTFNGTVQHTWPYLLFSYFVSESTSSCSQTRNENTATMEYPLIIHGTNKFPFLFQNLPQLFLDRNKNTATMEKPLQEQHCMASCLTNTLKNILVLLTI